MSYHEARVNSGSYVSAERVPTFRIEEVPKLLEVVVDEELGGPEVEPGIELMDDRLVSDD
jgi:hypothetical protein